MSQSLIGLKHTYEAGTILPLGDFMSKKKNSTTYEVPQDSIFSPFLFNLYMLPLDQIIHNNNMSYHDYADDTQLYTSLSSNDCSPVDSLIQCTEQINDWMCQNSIQLNKDKIR